MKHGEEEYKIEDVNERMKTKEGKYSLKGK